MTTPERLARACLLPSFPGHEPPDWVLRELDAGLGGITLFAYNVRDHDQLAGLTARLRDGRELLLAIDEEGGDVTRLEAGAGSSYPGALALGVVDDPELTEAVAAAIAAELARAGVNLNLAPVADANTNPLNPVIGVRSFGAAPELVARHVAAFVRGTQRQGVAACAKHFPGHGDAAVDSHLDLPTVGGDLEAALLPFRAAIEAGVQAVMTAHLLVPELDTLPATLSRRILTDLLRAELGFEGLVITDALEMRAISGGAGVEEAAVLALAAGADALCVGHDLHEDAVQAIVRAVADAVAAGRLPVERLEEAAARVAATARWGASPRADGAPGPEIGAAAARRALRIHGTPAVSEPPLVVELAPRANIAAGELAHGLAGLWPGAAGVALAEGGDARAALGRAEARPVVVVTRDAGRHAWERAAVAELLALRPDAIVIETGLPGGVGAAIETHGAGRASLEAARDTLLGAGDREHDPQRVRA
ncbi:MAG TPA: glycoside hydrolase family 3 N-terminal domain-containing protein [Gaiellaceae bacterium]